MMNIPTNFNDIDWDLLQTAFPDIAALKGCPQAPIFHAEGDVFTHTKMVLEALMQHPDWRQSDAETQKILWWATLFHDIAKPFTTIEEDGRIRSPRHAIKGAQLTQNLLYQHIPKSVEYIPLAQRQEIVHLIRYHGLPLWFWDKDDMLYAVIEASHHISCEFVAFLSEVDVLGRICNDQQDLLDRITLFREYCSDNHVYDKPYAFPSTHSRFLYFQNPVNHPTYEAYDDTTCEVILMSGLPGAGKDTWLSEQNIDLPILSLDGLREQMGIKPTGNQSAIITAAKEQARDYLRHNQSFVWNATNLTRRLRKSLIDLFTRYNARVKIVYIEVPWQDILSRNLTREAPVPVNVLHKMAHLLEVPTVTEAHQVIWETAQ